MDRFDELARQWEGLPEPDKSTIRGIYSRLSKGTGDGPALEEAFRQYYGQPSGDPMADGAAEYEEIMLAQEAIK